MKHLDSERIQLWRSRKLEVAEILAVADHVEACAACREALSGREGEEEFVKALDLALERQRSAPYHPTAAQLESWVDGRSDPFDRELVESHAAVCARCRETAEDLRRFSSTGLAARPRPRRAWVGLAAAGLLLFVAAMLWRGDVRDPSPARLTHPAVEAADRVVEPPPPLLRDGDLRVEGNGTVAGLPQRWKAEVLTLLARPELTTPAVALDLRRSFGQFRDEGDEHEGAVALVEGPVSRVVLDSRPRFRWRGPATAVAYRVEVFGPRFVPVATSALLKENGWSPERELPRGALLTWKVVAIDADGTESMFPRPPAPPAVFRIASEESVAEIAAARATGSRLLAGVALWRAGMLREAADELALLAAENPAFAPARALARESRRGADAATDIPARRSR
jgi:hypothetical protein